MRYQVISKLGKRSRYFHIDAPDNATARRTAVQLVNGWYSTHSGQIGNKVWSEGTCVVRKDDWQVPILVVTDQ